MAGLILRLEGEPKTIYMSAFLTAVSNWVGMLADLDSGISGHGKGTLGWIVSDLATGSLQVAVESRSRFEDANYGPEVEEAAVKGLCLLEIEGLTPPYMSEVGITCAKRMLKLIGHCGVTGITIQNTFEGVDLTARASANIDQLLLVRHSALGSIEGKLAMSCLDDNNPHFLVYHHHTHKAVRCIFPTEMLGQVKDALGSRVVAMGQVHFNAKNEPVRVDIEEVRILRTESDLPSIARITGIDPDFTGDLSTAEYLRSVRGG